MKPNLYFIPNRGCKVNSVIKGDNLPINEKHEIEGVFFVFQYIFFSVLDEEAFNSGKGNHFDHFPFGRVTLLYPKAKVNPYSD